MRILIAAFMIMTIIVICPNESTGAVPEAIYLCSVEYAGPSYLTNSTTPGTLISVKVLSVVKNTAAYSWAVNRTYTFYAPTTMAKEYLATALTAMVNNKQVRVRYAKEKTTVSLNYMCLTDYDSP